MMARSPSPAAGGHSTLSGARLTGVDAARGLALLGMMATHLMPTFESDANLTPTWVGLAFSGRASALFAVLAGVGLALSTGRQVPLAGPALGLARRGIALRALVIAVVGLTLGGLEVNVAIILVHYAALFLCVLPFLGLPVRHLLAWAGGWILLAPLVAYLLRPWFLAGDPPLHLGHNPSWEDLGTPGPLLGDLFLTGYYPVFQWLAFVLVGLAIGRIPLHRARVAALLLVAGTAVAIAAKALGNALMEDWGGRQALEAVLDEPRWPLESLLQVNLTGIEQTGSWWWLATAAPHSGTTLDLLHSASAAAAVLGGCLLLGSLGTWLNLDLLLPLRGAGAMTLSLYTVHVWVLAAFYVDGRPDGWTDEGMYTAQAITAVALGILFAVLKWRGPLEQVAHGAHVLGSRPLTPVR
ncbi:heparan-alpha-glucosaminide N-acetyltransferase domain-containing protein [Pseudarthrobacter sp. J75]|uniref:heparan-alpha-glucosaminide N-acetyltransferase domain-containing protein n=1 Tax=unclassified Pseudarthrobacter TaxID=2647000 RepID=UPI002E80DFB3|nr:MULTISPECIES: heparan-alpha-glucosaminide N-acetyltransferase domain-containing protein [unclassified Pseudarthrobacter]MEE2521822.1 heparan-alpha-glucosaminide N-acetyltransferase domain-containing protein [Pseudarthrobacter sp. J47]MEE2527899.1 heparan-alpha-glucosaminide N-acetyltransferase domain-containing protein [Pseudarthrobacter sp. J75]